MANQRLRKRILAAAGALFGVCAFAVPVVPADADDVAFKLTDSRITECSGMASDTERGLYWMINDTEAAGGRIYGVKPDGRTTTSIRFSATIVDTEALSYVNDSFYVGDIGDNRAVRKTISIYKLTSPKVGATKATYTRYRFRYSDGPRDAEGMWVTSAGRIFIVSKEASGGIYAAPEKLSTSTTNVLKKVGSAPSLATDATLLKNGQVAIRTYTSVSILDPKSYKVVASSPTKLQRQGEAITTTLDGSQLLLGSEGKYSQVFSTPVPESASESPSVSATPSPMTVAPSATPTKASPEPSPTSSASESPSFPNNLVDILFDGQNLLWVAGGVSLIGALVVLLRRK